MSPSRFLPRRWFLRKLYNALGRPAIRISLATGESVGPKLIPELAGLRIEDDATLLRLCLEPDVGFGEAYAAGRVEVEGRLEALLEATYWTASKRSAPGPLRKAASQWLRWQQRNTLEGARQNIHQHYDLSTDFYKLWLDPQLVYTSAYFPTPSATLEEAQEAKLDLVCRKLQLRPGERVVEAGCGWGALALHMARQYGVRVRAYNIAQQQIAFARARALREGLANQVEFIQEDYRKITGRYDVFVSVGMLEHVGHENYEHLGQVIHRAIGDTGRGLLHFIGYSYPHQTNLWLRKHIFPGSQVPSLSEAMGVLEPMRYAALDVENLRLHYALTLQHWWERFEAALPRLPAGFDEHFVRAWRLYLAGVMTGFRVGILQLYQIVFAGAACRWLPWTRAHLYSAEMAVPPEREPQWTAATH
jgi:cyclopropane-fatty-acyl-phospholipid synthase